MDVYFPVPFDILIEQIHSYNRGCLSYYNIAVDLISIDYKI